MKSEIYCDLCGERIWHFVDIATVNFDASDLGIALLHHTDEKDCYVGWTVYGKRPAA